MADNINWGRELEVMDSLSKLRHPSIMDFYGYKIRPDGIYFFMEFCGGGTLT